jgi:hypothetical protein
VESDQEEEEGDEPDFSEIIDDNLNANHDDFQHFCFDLGMEAVSSKRDLFSFFDDETDGYCDLGGELEEDLGGAKIIEEVIKVSSSAMVLYTGDTDVASVNEDECNFADEELSSTLGIKFTELSYWYELGWYSMILNLKDITDVSQVQKAHRKLSLAVHPDKHLSQKKLAGETFIILKKAADKLLQSLPEVLSAFQSFESNIEDSTVGSISTTRFLKALLSLKHDPIAQTFLKRAYTLALPTENILTFYDTAMRGSFAVLLAEIQSSIFWGDDVVSITDEDHEFNIQLMLLDTAYFESNADVAEFADYKGIN